MRKIVNIAAACLCMLVLMACGSDLSTPEATVTKAIKCLMEKDYQGYVELIQFKNQGELTKEQLEAKKTQVIAVLQDKGTRQIDAKGGIKSFTLEEPAYDGDKAKVKAVVTYGNDETKDQNFDVVKTENGEWKLDAGK